MRILLDECVPSRLREAFPGHAVQTVTKAGWRGEKDAPLLSFAETRFDIFVTVDRRLLDKSTHQFRLGIVVARVPNNRLDGFRTIYPQLKAAVETVRPGQAITVLSPELHP